MTDQAKERIFKKRKRERGVILACFPKMKIKIHWTGNYLKTNIRQSYCFQSLDDKLQL